MAGHVVGELAAYADGRLTTGEARRVAEHALGCRRCRRALDQVNRGKRLAAGLAPRGASVRTGGGPTWAEMAPLLGARRRAPGVWTWLPGPAALIAGVATAALVLLVAGGLFARVPVAGVATVGEPATAWERDRQNAIARRAADPDELWRWVRASSGDVVDTSPGLGLGRGRACVGCHASSVPLTFAGG